MYAILCDTFTINSQFCYYHNYRKKIMHHQRLLQLTMKKLDMLEKSFTMKSNPSYSVPVSN